MPDYSDDFNTVRAAYSSAGNLIEMSYTGMCTEEQWQVAHDTVMHNAKKLRHDHYTQLCRLTQHATDLYKRGVHLHRLC